MERKPPLFLFELVSGGVDGPGIPVIVQPDMMKYKAVCPGCAYAVNAIDRRDPGYCPACHVRLTVTE